MVQYDNENDTQLGHLLPLILEILDTALEGSVELLQRLYDQDIHIAKTLLQDLRQVTYTVVSAQESILDAIQHGSTTEQLENIADTLSEIDCCLEEQDLSQAQYLTEYQLLPFIRLLKEAFYFWGGIYPDQSKMAQYYENEFAQHYRSPYFQEEGSCKYQLSIVVVAYNHLDITKRCMEHILRYADLEKLNAELVLIDHGSSDETLAFFRSIPNAKVIHFKHNVRMYMFAAIPLICEGKYINFVSNDILVTENWAENLITCMESDCRIAAAIPMTPNISNLQMLDVPSNDPEEFVHWANKFNHSAPELWSDRARLIPPTCMYRMGALCELGLADPYFYSMEFWDDDFSLRARRKGYRQVLCEDTACYHFGSVTSEEAKKNEGTLQYGRELFYQKHHVDPWGNGFCYDYTSVQIAKQCLKPAKNIDLLALDCGFGDTPLQIRNEFRRIGCNVTLHNLTTEKKYAMDLQPLSDHFVLCNTSLVDVVSTCFSNTEFDLVCLGKDAGCYPDIEELIVALYNRIVPGGFLLFNIENPWYVLNLDAIIRLSLPQKRISWIVPDALRVAVEAVFSSVQVIPVKREVQGTHEFIKKYIAGQQKSHKLIEEQVSIQNYYFVCRK